MQVLHTSDWHAGRTTYNRSRAIDLDDALTEIISIARDVRPDAIINSGDLIDHSKVSHTEIERVVDALAELGAIAPTIVVAGNHDNFSQMRYLDRLGRVNRLYFVNKPVGISGDHLVIPGRDGNTLRVGALPFVSAERGVDIFDDPRQWAGDYRARIADLQARITAGLTATLDPTRELTVFAAHLHVTGAGLSGSERARHCSDDYACDPAAIPPVDYAAFGHIHDPQDLPGAVPGRYAGSPIPLDFGEAGQQKSITLVTLEPGKPTRCEPIALRGGRSLIRFDGSLTDLQSQAALIGDALCLATVHTDTHDPALSQRVHEILERATVLDVQQRVAGTRGGSLVVEPGTVTAQRPLLDSFSTYLQQIDTRTAPADQVMALMAEFLAADHEDRDPCFAVETLLTDDHTTEAAAT
ncbi:metallophosphoesterase family protein [Actinoplanes sp. RD1]|uniref:metallophosphoesterase family protein n=1 Tax=Actinoplanes sp. RD1 TaxID=3064538 RepID=UPI00274169AE|nr:exonuclease SbcCD subunit D [Actinoplanes sp. RD1]